VTKSSNHTLSFHRPISNSSSTMEFPCLSPTDNCIEFSSLDFVLIRIQLILLLACFILRNPVDTHHRKQMSCDWLCVCCGHCLAVDLRVTILTNDLQLHVQFKTLSFLQSYMCNSKVQSYLKCQPKWL
jgi:hypothetical protein